MEKVGPQKGMVTITKQHLENLRRDCKKGWLCCYCIKSLTYCENKEWRETVDTEQNEGGIQTCEWFKPSNEGIR